MDHFDADADAKAEYLEYEPFKWGEYPTVFRARAYIVLACGVDDCHFHAEEAVGVRTVTRG